MKRVVSGFLLSVVLCLAFLGRGGIKADGFTAVLLPGADTGLYEMAPTNNLGGSLAVPVGVHSGAKRSRYLVRFDPGGVFPAGAVVTGVELRIQVTVAGSPAHDYGMHRMLRDWAEGSREGNNGSGAIAGETTWLAQYHPAVTWASPGGGEGVDYAGVPSVTGTLGGDGSTNYFSGPELAADVQAWLDDPGLNFGWMIRAVDESLAHTARRIASRESAGTGPLLIVHYLPPDADGDGVPNEVDQCPDTAQGALVNAGGCSLEQLASCAGLWTNHGQYVAAVAAATDGFVRAGLLTASQRAEILRAAAQSQCGR